jgi:hypothetical protein
MEDDFRAGMIKNPLYMHSGAMMIFTNLLDCRNLAQGREQNCE